MKKSIKAKIMDLNSLKGNMCNVQVSAFGDDQVSDHLDVWEVSFTGAQWMRDQKVRLSSQTACHSCIAAGASSDTSKMTVSI